MKTLSWQNKQRVIETVDQLNQLLDTIEAEAGEAKPMVELTDSAGPTLAVGLGRPRSVATYQATLDPPYFASKGKDSAGKGLVFFYQGAWSEFPAEHVIAAEDAKEALRLFLQTGKRPANIIWQEV